MTSTTNEPPRYRAYLLRCWEERSSTLEAAGAWRFSIEDARSGERRGFATLEALMMFLQTELCDSEDDAD